ncbi:hypothetical protein GS571_02070 [Rhodococcus hoagii]|nr:hypothetical protein [Prescottella equi]
MHARQVARVGEFPREADRGVETEFELVYETTDLGTSGAAGDDVVAGGSRTEVMG